MSTESDVADLKRKVNNLEALFSAQGQTGAAGAPGGGGGFGGGGGGGFGGGGGGAGGEGGEGREGPEGPEGPEGAEGQPGIVGEVNEKGEWTPPAAGPAGKEGKVGPAGPEGKEGKTGPPGEGLKLGVYKANFGTKAEQNNTGKKSAKKVVNATHDVLLTLRIELKANVETNNTAFVKAAVGAAHWEQRLQINTNILTGGQVQEELQLTILVPKGAELTLEAGCTGELTFAEIETEYEITLD